MEDIIIYELEKVNLEGAVVIDGFPSIGLVSTIVGNYLINSLNLRQIAVVDSPNFPSLTVVRNSEAMSPVRIYAGRIEREEEGIEEPLNIVVFISEFVPPSQFMRPISNALLDWFEENKCDLILSPEGISQDIPLLEKGGTEKENIPVFGLGSTTRIKNLIEAEEDINPLQHGAITGVSANLLTAGKRRNIDVMCLLTEAAEQYPDARAAGTILEIIDKVSLLANIDPTPLYKEAQVIESQIKKMHKQAKPAMKKGQKPVPQYMYG